MSTERFRASVQYGDLKGTVAADRSDWNIAEKWLDKNGLRKPDERVVGISAAFYENRKTHVDEVGVEVGVDFLLTTQSYDAMEDRMRTGEPISVRQEYARMPLAEFAGFFKRLSIKISSKGILTDAEYTIQDE